MSILIEVLSGYFCPGSSLYTITYTHYALNCTLYTVHYTMYMHTLYGELYIFLREGGESHLSDAGI